MNNINREILNEFTKLTKFNVVNYYAAFLEFMRTDYNDLENYFSGKTEIINPLAFKRLNNLINVTDHLFSTLTQIKDKLNNYMWFELIDQLENMSFELQFAKNISKWLRSPKTNTSYSDSIELQLTLKQNQTLENVNKDTLNEVDWQNSWVKTAKRNNLKEEDYSLEGGVLLNVSLTQSGSIFINAVVDNISGEKVMGLDIDRKITFENDDLKVLNYVETFKQSVYVLSSLKQNDDPFYPINGVDANSVVGSNISTINYPSIFRQMSSTFATDDTIINFSITDIKRIQDAIYATFEVQNRIGDNENFKINIIN